MVNVDSNDALYGDKPEFKEDVAALSARLLNDVLTGIQQGSAESDDKSGTAARKQARLALDLVNLHVACGDMADAGSVPLCARLMKVAAKALGTTNVTLKNTALHIKRLGRSKSRSDAAAFLKLQRSL